MQRLVACVSLIFASNDATEPGIAYDDRTGISYEYPKRYGKLIQEGKRFIYYRGRRTSNGSRQPQVYFGTGVVGKISPKETDGDRLVCYIESYRPFVHPVPFKDSEGIPLEIRGVRKGYYQPGVRRITELEFDRILVLAGLTDEPPKL